MTNPTPHGQVPEALRLAEQYDHGDPAAHGNAWKAAVCTELRRQHTRIAELESELEAVGAGGVQALSAAPVEVADALADSQYLAGVSAGWNAANADDPNAALQKLHESRAGYLQPLRAARAPSEQQAPATGGYVQPVPDKCDRITWRGRYYHLPPTAQAAPKAAPGVGNSGFDHQTAADFLSGKTVSDEAVRKFVAASRWAHDEKAALSAMLLSVRGVLASREAEIALLKKALLEAEAAPQPAPGEPSEYQIRAITTAYEQGVGKGHQAYKSGKEITNPYDSAYGCDMAWQYGYREGKEQAQRGVKAAAGEPSDVEIDDFLDSPACITWVIASNRDRYRLLVRAVLAKWAAPQQDAQEPVAYAIFAENGNIRLWATEPQHVKRIAAEQGLSLVKLYAAPQPAPAPLSESIDQLERNLAIIGVVGVVDGHDVVRRESVLEIARRAALAAQKGTP